MISTVCNTISIYIADTNLTMKVGHEDATSEICDYPARNERGMPSAGIIDD